MTRERPPDRLLSADGKSGWYSFPPDGARVREDEPWEPPPDGATVRFMGEHTVQVPLWETTA